MFLENVNLENNGNSDLGSYVEKCGSLGKQSNIKNGQKKN